MRRLIFRLVFLFVVFFSYFSNAESIIEEYKIFKKNIDAEFVTSSQNYFFASSYSKASSIEETDIESNKMIASAKLIDHLSTFVNWPKKIDLKLRNSLWNFYVNQRKFKFEKLQMVDKGKLGKYFYVVVGIPKKELLKKKIKFNDIIIMIQK